MRFLGLTRREDGALVPAPPAEDRITSILAPLVTQTPTLRQAQRNLELARVLEQQFAVSARAINAATELVVVRETAETEVVLRLAEARHEQESRALKLKQQQAAREQAERELEREKGLEEVAYRNGISVDRLRHLLSEENARTAGRNAFHFSKDGIFDESPGQSHR